LEVHGWVRDTGRGINSEKLQDIWRPFTSVETKTEDGQSSHGLGLSIVHGIVETMGGEINVSSTEGQGSLFSFRVSFPLVKNSEDRASVPPTVVPQGVSEVPAQGAPKELDLRSLRVLVAEDEKIARMVVVYLFRSWGAQVDEAEDGKVALELWKVHGHDIVVLDDHMGGLEGPEMIRRIRNIQGERNPLIILSSADMAYRDSTFVLEGADAMLPKPVNKDKLKKIIGDALLKR
jgi:CheY-like chemotaxis protein